MRVQSYRKGTCMQEGRKDERKWVVTAAASSLDKAQD